MTTETDNQPGQVCGVHHISLQTHNLEASLRLYCDVLGMQIVSEFGKPERRIFLLDSGNGSHIELVAPINAPSVADVPTANHPLRHIALTTTDVRQVIERVRSAGCEITVEPKEVQLGQMLAVIAFFKGPSGELIEFFQTVS